MSLMYSRHWVVVVFLIVLQIMSFRELIGVRYREAKEQQLPWFRTLSWFAFCLSEFVAYGAQAMRFMEWHSLTQYHALMSLAAFVLYFTMFVLSLQKKRLYKYQITQLAWTWLVLLLVVGQAWGAWFNIFRGGIFFFLLPAGQIVCNDIWAYFMGLSFGGRFIKRPFLPKLSPNKTWEGFLGAFFWTLFFTPIQVYLYTLPDFWVCPHDLMDASYHCVRPYVFSPHTYILPKFLENLFGSTLTIAPVYGHAFVFAIFASLIAPFGGFFASGIKRAFGKKDFDSIFPGHGGVVDRLDCQMIMQLFVWIYLRTFVMNTLSVEHILAIAALWPTERKRELIKGLQALVK